MKYKRTKTSRVAAFLIIFGIVAGLLSVVSAVEGADYLQAVYPNRTRVMVGAFFQLLLVPCYIGFSLVLYHVLRAYNRSLSLGFVGFRFLMGAFQLIGVMLLPLFILLSEQYLSDTSFNPTYYETIGELLKVLRDLTNHLGVMLATGLGNLLLYFVFLKGKHIPAWLSWWGVMGNTLIAVAGFFLLFHWIEVISATYGIMAAPLVLQEIVLAIWLLFKGLKLGYRN